MGNFLRAELFRIRKKDTLLVWLVPLMMIIFVILLMQTTDASMRITDQASYISSIRSHSLDLIEALPFFSFPILFYAVYMEDQILHTQGRNLAQNLKVWEFVLAKAALFSILQLLTCLILLASSWIDYGIIVQSYHPGFFDFLLILPDVCKSMLVMLTGVFMVTMLAAAALYAFNSALSGLVAGMIMIVHVPALLIHYLANEIPQLHVLADISVDIRYIDQMTHVLQPNATLDPIYFIMAITYGVLAILWQMFFLKRIRS